MRRKCAGLEEAKRDEVLSEQEFAEWLGDWRPDAFDGPKLKADFDR